MLYVPLVVPSYWKMCQLIKQGVSVSSERSQWVQGHITATGIEVMRVCTLLRLTYLDIALVLHDILTDVRCLVVKVTEDIGLDRACDDTGRHHARSYTVCTIGTFIGSLCLRIDIDRTIWTSHDAACTTNTTLFVDIYDAILYIV